MELKQYNFDQIAKYYDLLELPNSSKNREQNMFLFRILKKLNVRRVLDMGCGTGVQALFLKKKGFDVVGIDPSEGLLEVAQKKAKHLRLDMLFKKGDMKTSVEGEFDCVISMYNSIGHVTKDEFKNIVLDNVKKNLVDEGVFIFDIFNYDFFSQFEGTEKHDEEYTAVDGTTIYRYTENTVHPNKEYIHVNHRNEILHPDGSSEELTDSWDMQLYCVDFLIEALEEKGFEVIGLYGSQDGEEFIQEASTSIYIVAKKI
jgi:2-polyprenyl-3-methyl-5-hydroxy-6-metoxy-1,4-benzoquinol methylase